MAASRVFVIALATAAIAACGSTASNNTSKGAGSTPTPAPYTADCGGGVGFTAVFPGEPKRTTQDTTAADGSTITAVLFDSYAPSGEEVAAACETLPAGQDPQTTLDNAISGSAGNVPSGQVSSKNNLTWLGSPAEDAVISSSDGTISERVVFVGNTLYIITGVPKNGDHSGYDAFLATFKATGTSS